MGGEKEGRKKARGPRAKSNKKKNERGHCEDDGDGTTEFAQGRPFGTGQCAAAVAFEIFNGEAEADYGSKDQQPYAYVEQQSSYFIHFHKPMFYSNNPRAKVMV